MNILLIGGGGREHALAWKLADSAAIRKDGGTLYATPGNPGIAEVAEIEPLPLSDRGLVVDFCKAREIGLVVVGPEAPLVDGLANALRAAKVPVFGPSRAPAQLEGSKGFTKDLCKRADIPTAEYVRTASAEDALAKLDGFGLPVVIKADGIAAGKGVVIAETREAAEAAIVDMFDGAFGDAGAEVVLEEYMTGEEASFFAITDGKSILPFGSAQDHKRVGEGDTGPNTGGMGAYSPAPVLTAELEKQVMERIVRPTVEALAAEDMPYVGVLYAGLMLTEEGPKLIEYNCRFGDPEAQVLMMRYRGDLAALMLACATGKLDDAEPGEFAPDYALTVVMAARGYPGTPEKGGAIAGLERVAETGAMVFHAGTALDEDGELIANGGRVLNVTAMAPTVREAQAAAYRGVDLIDFATGFCRRDIGWREVAREAGN